MNEVYLIGFEEIKNAFPVKNVDEDYIKPAIRLSQEKELQQSIGTRLYERLIEMVSTETLTDDYRELLDGYIKPLLLWNSLGELTAIVTYKVRNAGVVQNYGEHTNTVTFSDADKLQNKFFQNANFYLERLRKYLNANVAKFPEYKETKDCSDFKSRNNWSTSLFLGGD